MTATRPSGPRGRSVSVNVPASAGLRVRAAGMAIPPVEKDIRSRDPGRPAGPPGAGREPSHGSCAATAAAGKRARASLRTGVRPVGNGLGLRCLLGARAPPGSNPPPSRGRGAAPFHAAPGTRGSYDPLLAQHGRGGSTAPAGWPGAGLRSNIPSIAAMSTGPGGRRAAVIAAVARPCSPLSCGDTIEPRALVGDGGPVRFAGFIFQLEDENDRKPARHRCPRRRSRCTGARRSTSIPRRVHRPGQRRRPGHLRPVREDNFPDCFKEYADLLSWDEPWHTTLDTSNPPFWKWFVGGKLNASYNCVDRHAAANPDKTAIVFVPELEDDEPRPHQLFGAAPPGERVRRGAAGLARAEDR